MTSYLLDTHALLWWVDNDSRLDPRVRDEIATAERVMVSDVSLWELIIKCGVGKLTLSPDAGKWFERHTAASRFGELAISRAHLHAVQTLPMHHRDPFDRLLIAQATVENLTLISNDSTFAPYDINVLW